MAMLWPVDHIGNAVFAVLVASVVGYPVFKFVRAAVWEPLRLRRIMAKQGVRGPPFKFLLGQYTDLVEFSESFPEGLPMDDLANLSPTVTPQYAMYFPKYGKMFLYWWGTVTRLVVRDPEVVKELLITNHDSLVRCELESMLLSQVSGEGLATHDGEKWRSDRRTFNPVFNHEALKAMVKTMVQGATQELQIWEQKVAEAGGKVEISAEQGLYRITGKIVSLMTFGDNFEMGEQIFKFQTLLMEELLKMLQSTMYWLIPGYRYLPTKGNRLISLYRSKADALIHGIVHGRQEAIQKGNMHNSGSNDTLGRMLAVATNGWDQRAQEFNLASVSNSCKLFHFGGHDTVSNALVFSMLMLALHPQWQERVRAEILESLGEEHSWSASGISHLKVMGMVCNETLRLFPPAISVTRVATKDLRLQGLFVPKGMTIECALAAIHQDPDYWGPDVGEFNPGRFADGAAQACSHRQAFFPFGLGPRNCVGNSMAAMEARVVLAMVLRRFQLLPSPAYKHHPVLHLVQKPKFGMPIVLKAL